MSGTRGYGVVRILACSFDASIVEILQESCYSTAQYTGSVKRVNDAKHNGFLGLEGGPGSPHQTSKIVR